MTTMSAAYWREWRKRRASTRVLPLTRSTIAAMWGGLRAAQALGHRMAAPTPDVSTWSAIAECEDCPQYVVVDLEESPEAYGGALTRPCALRRMSRYTVSTEVA